jgi:DNA-directed RNA polymerase specialized sigma24 family protein
VPTPKLKALYKKVGPTLFARAQRALKDDGAAQDVVQEVVIELSRLGDLSDAELLTTGRDILKKRLKQRGSDLDSMNPESE